MELTTKKKKKRAVGTESLFTSVDQTLLKQPRQMWFHHLPVQLAFRHTCACSKTVAGYKNWSLTRRRRYSISLWTSRSASVPALSQEKVCPRGYRHKFLNTKLLCVVCPEVTEHDVHFRILSPSVFLKSCLQEEQNESAERQFLFYF